MDPITAQLEADLQAEIELEGVRLEGAELDAAIDRALERIREAELEVERVRETARLRIEPVERWRDTELEKIYNERAFWTQRVHALAAGYDFGRKKSRSLPSGTFGYRTKPVSIAIADTAAAVAFAKAAGLPIKESVNVSELTKHFKTTGEIPDGCEVLPESETFFVKPGE